MLNKKLIVCGIVLIAFDICLYGLFHDISKLALFALFDKEFLIYLKAVHLKFMSLFSGTLIFQIIRNYFIDFLWFLSFQLLCLGYFSKTLSLFIVLFGGILTEVFQLLKPCLGTFDFVDLIIYISITLVLFVFVKSKDRN